MRAQERLFGYLKPYTNRVVYAILAMCAVALFNGTSILLLKPIVDKIFIAKDFRMLWLAVVALPLVIALKTVASYAQNYLMSWLGQKVTQEIREDLFRHLHRLPLEYYAGQRSGEIISRATGDLVVLQSALNSVPLYLIRDSMTVLALLASLFYLDWRFALLSLAGVPLIGVTLWVLSRKMRATSHQSQLMMGRITQRFQESIQGMALIKAFNYDEGVLSKFEEENDSFFAPTMSYLRASALSGPLLELCGGIVAALILYFGGREVIDGFMTPGAFFAFLGAFLAAYAPIKNLARSNSELQRALTCASRVFQVLNTPADPKCLPSPAARPFEGIETALCLQSVWFRYPGHEDFALKGLDLSVAKGRRVAIVGPSGSGKTTVARLLLRLHDPERGRVLYDGRDVRELELRSLRDQVGLVSQECLLFNDTVFQNVTLGRKVVTLSQVERACQLSGASEFIARLPEGYQTRLGDGGVSLSAGQSQKLAIARVILKDPSILILDEATANLDSASEAEILAVLETQLAGRTVIMIAHTLSTLPRCDEIFVLSQGTLVESGAHEALIAKNGLYKRLYELQTGAQ
jgi:subfamily B ATP-binding cassette protein MsbA